MFKTFLLYSNIMTQNFNTKKSNYSIRNCIVTPDMVGKTFKVSSGRLNKIVLITKLHIGHFLGEFARTRTCEHVVKSKHRVKSYEHSRKKLVISR